ncbi:MAG: N-acetylneuraminate synthase family protein [Selenomonadaceae bacterium]|nr:N-acetylneuraminate synthase family protein [Selenomonadaceae bacterium]
MNSSHNGKVETAKEMIAAAKACGCDAVKFQSWTADSLYCADFYEENPIARRMVERFSLSEDALLELAVYSREIGIDFSSTPYSEAEVDFLVDECRAPFVKIASMDINNLPYLRYIAKKRVPVVLSTGMADYEEIEKAARVMEEAGVTDLCILHCVSLYPVELAHVNLNNILMLAEKFPQHAVGYSDHTIGATAAGAAVAMGAGLIEKHFTMDNRKNGWDNRMGTEPKEMEKLVRHCHEVYAAMGTRERIVSEDEKKQREKMRRSLVAARDLPIGAELTAKDIKAKRPGTGISVADFDKMPGRKLNCFLPKDRMLREEFLQ